MTSRAGGSGVEHALLRGFRGAVANLARLCFAGLLDRGFGEIANDGIDVAADVADFGEFGRFDLDERSVGELGQAAGDLGLADAGRSDHQNVFRRDLLAQGLGDLLPAPAVPERDGDRALCGVLSDNVLVELVDDLRRRHERHGGSRRTHKEASRVWSPYYW